ncbi:hypothetical protein D3C72_2355270 [compost metagenome]
MLAWQQVLLLVWVRQRLQLRPLMDAQIQQHSLRHHRPLWQMLVVAAMISIIIGQRRALRR